jgi:hypothetical protein
VNIDYDSTLQQYSADIPAATKRVLTINGSGDVGAITFLQSEDLMKFNVKHFSMLYMQYTLTRIGLTRAT